MPPLETLVHLEIEFHRKLRTDAPGTADTTALHTSYALQAGYEPLIRAADTVTGFHDCAGASACRRSAA